MKTTKGKELPSSGSGVFMTQVSNALVHGNMRKTLDLKPDEVYQINDVELHADYVDNDFEIYFDKFSLLDHLAHLEEDNLFKIHLV
jgi:hypothetical protein